MNEHKDEIDSYSAGYGVQQNIGKLFESRKVIQRNEVAYGGYEW